MVYKITKWYQVQNGVPIRELTSKPKFVKQMFKEETINTVMQNRQTVVTMWLRDDSCNGFERRVITVEGVYY